LTIFFFFKKTKIDGQGIGKNGQGVTKSLDQKYKASRTGIGKNCFVFK